MLRIRNMAAITAAIDGFDPGYHRDYFTVRALARAFLASTPSAVAAIPLAEAARGVLINWGAGKRSAPACRSVEVMATCLADPDLHSGLARLAASPAFLSLANGTRTLRPGALFASVADFDECLLGALEALAAGLLERNTNVTYPMKALLLLTGLMPAFDSQVRGGLAVAGVGGINRTRYPMPTRGSADAQKICALPFYLADCADAGKGLGDAIRASRYPTLLGDTGRLFDVVLFMQKDRDGRAVAVEWQGPAMRQWYCV